MPSSKQLELEQNLSILDSYSGTVKISVADTILRLRNGGLISVSSNDRSSYQEYTVHGACLIDVHSYY